MPQTHAVQCKHTNTIIAKDINAHVENDKPLLLCILFNTLELLKILANLIKRNKRITRKIFKLESLGSEDFASQDCVTWKLDV